jgi:hypothetical protein
MNQRMGATLQTIAVALWLVLLLVAPARAERWSFAVIADHRSVYSSYRNVLNEIKQLRVNPAPRLPAVDFVLACGDLDPLTRNYEIYLNLFGSKPPLYFPVRGNHERPDDVDFILKKILPAHGKSIQLRDQESVNYYVDWKNVRLIVLDQYPVDDKDISNPGILSWLAQTISSTGNANHIFIAYHEPNLPRDLESSAFWRLLLQHHDKVRAVFHGHTHIYERRRVSDGNHAIEVINAGNAGKSVHSDNHQTIVEVLVDGPYVFLRTLQAADGSAKFRVVDQWEGADPGMATVNPSGPAPRGGRSVAGEADSPLR